MTRYIVAIVCLLSGLVAHGSLPRWFDAANRLTNTVSPLGYSNSVAYNHQGLISAGKDPAQHAATFNYDAKGRLTNRTDSVGSTLYRYNPNDNVTNISENGLTNSWAYDAYGRVAKYTEAFGNSIGYHYDANGNLTNLTYPGNRVVSYAYDSLNRLTNVTDWANRKTSFTYDLAGRMVSLTRPNGTARTNGYDAAGQLTNFFESTSAGWPLVLAKLNFDAAGRVAWEFLAPPPHTNAPPSRTMAYDDDNRLATVNGNAVSLDGNGNLTAGPMTNDAFAVYTYDARNRMAGTTSTASLTYGYDPAGNRVAMTNGADVTRFVIDPNAKLPRVLMRVKPGSTNYYIYGAGLIYEITETATSTNTLSYHYDYRGSTVALSDDAGRVTDRIEYSLYGSLTYRLGSSDTPFLFNGRYGVMTDANGLLYMRARYYNPYLCRFINPDPSGFSGGLNFYAYANGNPVSLLDPFGLGAAGEGAVSSWLNRGADAIDNFNADMGDLAGRGLGLVYSGIDYMVQNRVGMSSGASGGNEPGPQSLSVMLLLLTDGESSLLRAGAETGAKPFAMGLDAELDSFAQARGATTWKQFPNAEDWKLGVLDKLADPNTQVHFNLNGVNVWGGVQRAASGAGGATDWELLQIQQNPHFWGTTTFWQNGQVAPNPFH